MCYLWGLLNLIQLVRPAIGRGLPNSGSCLPSLGPEILGMRKVFGQIMRKFFSIRDLYMWR